MKRLALLAGALALCLGARAAGAPAAADLEFFERKVRPVLSEHCASCHAKGKARGRLDLGSRAGLLKGGESGPAVVPGDPGKSLLIQAVRYHKPDLRMPPKGKLPDAVVADLSTWVERGAPWPASPAPGGADSGLRAHGTPITAKDRAFWSFRPVADPPPPAVEDGAWPRRPLDAFVLAKLEAKGLRPVRPASRHALIRRVTFDLLGLPPTPEEVDAFVADERPDAYERLVDRLLASPHYGEKWGRHWLDVARYGEDQAHNFRPRLYPHGHRYRDWVARAFNADLPYDRFILAQVAGDLIEGTPEERLPALGFFATGPVYYVGEGKLSAAAELDDRVDTFTRGFLGLTVSCARCHDHKYDPITQKDYYALAGVFRSSQYQLAPLAPPAIARRYLKAVDAVTAQEAKVQEHLREQGTRLAEGKVESVAAHMVAAWKLAERRKADPGLNAAAVASEGKLEGAAAERWYQFLFRRGAPTRASLAGWRKALAGMDVNKDLSSDADALAKVTAAAAAFQAELQEIVRERDALLKDGKKADALGAAKAERLREVFSPPQGPFRLEPRQVEKGLKGPAKETLTELRAELARLQKAVPPAPPMAHALTEGTPADMPVYVRGNPDKEGEVAPRRFLAVLGGDEAPRFTKGSGRLELARAIADPKNPLTARVMVNRVWQHHFGKGVVGTPSNFGQLGERPTHPELLDHLATRFVASGWSVKALHRDILLSATYRLGSDYDARNAAADPGNALSWRMDRRRLDVEAWRDAMLAAAGRLDRSVGGPPTNLAQPGNARRTVYGAVSRHNLDGLLRLFDFPDPNLTSEKRPVTVVPLQQLFVLNSDFMVEQARALAKHLAAQEKDDEARVRLAYRRLYARPARDAEVRLGLEFLTAPEPADEPRPALTRWEQYAQVLLAANEFTFLD